MMVLVAAVLMACNDNKMTMIDDGVGCQSGN
jgi:hypothetical protein